MSILPPTLEEINAEIAGEAIKPGFVNIDETGSINFVDNDALFAVARASIEAPSPGVVRIVGSGGLTDGTLQTATIQTGDVDFTSGLTLESPTDTTLDIKRGGAIWARQSAGYWNSLGYGLGGANANAFLTSGGSGIVKVSSDITGNAPGTLAVGDIGIARAAISDADNFLNINNGIRDVLQVTSRDGATLSTGASRYLNIQRDGISSLLLGNSSGVPQVVSADGNRLLVGARQSLAADYCLGLYNDVEPESSTPLVKFGYGLTGPSTESARLMADGTFHANTLETSTVNVAAGVITSEASRAMAFTANNGGHYFHFRGRGIELNPQSGLPRIEFGNISSSTTPYVQQVTDGVGVYRNDDAPGTLQVGTTQYRNASNVQFGQIGADGASLEVATSSAGWPLVLSGDGVRIDAGAAGTQNLQIGGLTINPGNGAHTLDQTFALQLRTANALNLIHGTGDPCYVKPRSGVGVGKIGFQNGTNSYQSHISGGSGEVSFYSALNESALASIQASALRNALGPVSLQGDGVELDPQSGLPRIAFGIASSLTTPYIQQITDGAGVYKNDDTPGVIAAERATLGTGLQLRGIGTTTLDITSGDDNAVWARMSAGSWNCSRYGIGASAVSPQTYMTSGGAGILRVSSDTAGLIGGTIETGAVEAGSIEVENDDPAATPLSVKAAIGQTGNIQQWLDGADNAVMTINDAGFLTVDYPRFSKAFFGGFSAWVTGTSGVLELATSSTARMRVEVDGAIKVFGLPTSDPSVADQLWRDGTDLKISAG